MTKLTKEEALKELDQINERAEALKEYIEQAESKGVDKPKDGQTYWYIDKRGEKCLSFWTDEEIENAYLEAGNIFSTEEEADNHILRLESMANRGEMPEEGEEFCYWNFDFGYMRKRPWNKSWFTDWFIGSVHKTEEECRVWYAKYGKAFKALMK
jgi:hypothetical protein